MLELIVKNPLGSRIMFFGQMKVNSTCLDRMGRLWYGDQRKKNWIQSVLFQRLNMVADA